MTFFPVLLDPGTEPVSAIILPVPTFITMVTIAEVELLFFAFSSSVDYSKVFTV